MDVLSRAQALERAGRHVVHMEIGEPDFTAPAPVVEAGVRALRDGRTAYTATLGLPALREAIAAHYETRFARRSRSRHASPSPPALPAGCSRSRALYVDPGDEILVPDPGYPGYRHFVRAFEGVAKIAAGLGQQRFPADARDGARGLGTAHQGPAARLAFESDRNPDFKKRTGKHRRASSPRAAAC